MEKKKRLRASGAAVWVNCPGSAKFTSKENPLNSNAPAELGTLIHSYCEYRLKYSLITFDAFVSELPARDQLLAKKNEGQLNGYSDFYLKSIKIIEAELRSEFDRVDREIEAFRVFGDLNGIHVGGTADLVFKCYDPDDILLKIVVVDLKTGQITVEAEDNLQLTVYGHLMAIGTEVEIEGVIIQPVNKSFDRADIPYSSGFLSSLIEESKSDELATGPQCMYCDHNDICPEFKEKVEAFLNPDFEEFTIDRVSEWSELLDVASAVTKVAEKVKVAAKTYIKQGFDVPGYRLAYRNGKRSWVSTASIDDIKALTGLPKNKLQKVTLFSPKQVEGMLNAKKVDIELTRYVVQTASPVLKKVKPLISKTAVKK